MRNRIFFALFVLTVLIALSVVSPAQAVNSFLQQPEEPSRVWNGAGMIFGLILIILSFWLGRRRGK
jgi:hypothetical protein